MVVDIHVPLAIREGLLSLDEIDLVPIFKRRACIMKAPPTFLKGACRSAMRLALAVASDLVASTRERGEDPQGEVVGAVHRVFPRPMGC